MKDLTVKQQINLVQIADSLTGVSPRTRETYVTAMRSYQNYCADNDTQMNLDSLRAWIVSANKPSTQSLRTAAARRIFGILYKNHPQLKELQQTIAEIKPVKRDMEVSSSKYVTVDELNQIIAAANPRIAVILKTLFVTGLRISPTLNIRHSDCTAIENGRVYEIITVSKGNKQSKKHISAELYEEIKSIFGCKTYLFEHKEGQYDRKYITAEIKRFGKVVGKNISAHSIRHSRAAELMDKGITIDKVSKFLDHSQLNTTAGFYLHSKPSLSELGVI